MYINAIIQVGDELKRSFSVCLSLHLKTSRSSNLITRIVPVFLIPKDLVFLASSKRVGLNLYSRFFLSISRSQSIKRNVVSRFLFFFFFEEDFFRWIRYAIFFLNLCSQFYVYFGRLWIWVGDATFSVQWYKWIGRATASVIRGYSIDCLPCRE